MFYKSESFCIFCRITGFLVSLVGMFVSIYFGPTLEAQFSWIDLYIIAGTSIFVGGFIYGMSFPSESLIKNLYWDWQLWAIVVISTVVLGFPTYPELAILTAFGIALLRHFFGFFTFVVARAGDSLEKLLLILSRRFKKIVNL